MRLLQDLAYARRQLVASPGMTGIAVITFALGIGATSAIFSAVYAVVLQPFPFFEPERVVTIGAQFGGQSLASVSSGNYEDWRTQASAFSALGGSLFTSVNVAGGATPDRLSGAAVTSSYFDVFRISPALGRTIAPDENRAGRERVVVLSHRLWTRMFNRDATAIGRRIALDGYGYEVIGVMPPAFDRLGGAEEFWVPVVFTPEQVASHDDHNLRVVGRLADGVSLAEADAELAVIFARMKDRLPGNTQVRLGIVSDYAADVIGDSRQRLLVLFGAVALVLLIACANVAHLLLARGRLRAHEVALRASLGASSAQLLQQFLVESLVLAGIGGGLGIGIAYLAIPALLALGPDATSAAAVPRLDQTTVDGTVLLFAVAATVVSALVAGLAPALRAARFDLKASLGAGARTLTTGGDRLRSVLVAAEVAVAVVLLTGAGLFIRSALYLQAVDQGFDGTRVLTARVSLPEAAYQDPARVEMAFRALTERLAQDPRVEYAAASSSVPMAPGATNNGLVPEGKAFDPDDFVLGRLGLIVGDYFRAFQIPVVAGRLFTLDDRRGAQPVMIVSETAARQLFPGENALGKRVRCCEAGPDGLPLLRLVVGIVGDVRSEGPQLPPRADFYVPALQAPPEAWTWVQRTMTLVVRGRTGNAADLSAVIRNAVRATDPSAPIHSVATMPQRLHTTLATDRFNTALMAVLGTVGLLLAAVGIYGVVSYFVAQRRHELAIRMALGARAAQLLGMVVNQGMRPVLLGALIGVGAAAALSRLLASYLFGVPSRDPVTFVAVALTLVAVALIANVLPARIAARANPSDLLVR